MMSRVSVDPRGGLSNREMSDMKMALGNFRYNSSEIELVPRTESFGSSTNSGLTIEADDIPMQVSGWDFPQLKFRLPTDEIIMLNVGGTIFKTRASTLAKYPDTLLGNAKRREEFYDPATNEYFFDRSPAAFGSVLEYYYSGDFVRPTTVPLHVFVRELLYYEIGEDAVENFLRAEDLYDDPPKEPKNPTQRLIYDLFNDPGSSLAAQMLAIFDICLVVLAMISLCTVTLPEFQDFEQTENGTIICTKAYFRENSAKNPFFVIDVVCNTWFLIDIIVRFLVSPSKKDFICTFSTVIDFVSIVPFIVDLIASAVSQDQYDGSATSWLLAFRILRFFRIFRAFKMEKYADGLRVLEQTFSNAHRELGIMLLFLFVGMVFFSATMYYAERGTAGTDYTSIPASFWWAIITWTTIGYGDVYPKTPSGKIVGCVCALTGVLTLGMIIPPVVRRFEHYFYRPQTMAELRKVFEEYDTRKRSQGVRGYSNSKEVFRALV
ncbi:hypothetical protein RvY_18419 [Ramazzottius varieornatus]|uniref:BTB domain-containing protein n=1 Tax=Ramazzottius varieornatus TaxID=947166 RepID=A0A1D1W798_RAMVA|nr:hypothetical protein RvY_18419 [Ramazzottius varieornatus]